MFLMRSSSPISLLFFAVIAVLFVLQLIPLTSILAFMLAMFWSALLVNAGMIGIAAEALLGRVSRWWLLVPFVFYGSYWSVALNDHMTLRSLSASYDAANASIAIPFDPVDHALAFVNGDAGPWLTQNYALPVAYSVIPNLAEGYLSHRMMDAAICSRVRETPALRAALINVFGFHDGDAISSRRMETRFCDLSTPERPELPLVQVFQKAEKLLDGSLPITRVTKTVTMPDGRQFQLLGGVAAPLRWIPMPVIGCGLDSAQSSWGCGVQFSRKRFMPIVSGNTRYLRDEVVLARALGLQSVAIEDRKGGDPTLVLAKMASVEDETLARQLANIDAVIADPFAKTGDFQIDLVVNQAEALTSRADMIMVELERLAAVSGNDFSRAQESGLVLARLLASLPRNKFVGFGQRILALYERVDDKHWIWRAEPLLGRLGELGTGALPYLINARSLPPSLNAARIEGLCRVGLAGRSVAEPALVTLWSRSRDGAERDIREAIFVAMRRIGGAMPLLVEAEPGQIASLQSRWVDVSPRSPSRVCAIRAERQARSVEKSGGQRRSNLD
ncbi:hypothetical protein [Shinella sp.]|uniref:hypothetical protein n=1 Tax=Shinella sp. TaxID=1870904 RepID=UPI0039E6CCD2